MDVALLTIQPNFCVHGYNLSAFRFVWDLSGLMPYKAQVHASLHEPHQGKVAQPLFQLLAHFHQATPMVWKVDSFPN